LPEGRSLFDLGLLVGSVFPVPFAVLVQLKLLLHGFPVLRGRIVTALAHGALQGDDLDGLLLRGHFPVLLGARLTVHRASN